MSDPIDSTKEPTFEKVGPMLTPPLDITRDMVRLGHMVDEDIEVHDEDTTFHFEGM